VSTELKLATGEVCRVGDRIERRGDDGTRIDHGEVTAIGRAIIVYHNGYGEVPGLPAFFRLCGRAFEKEDRDYTKYEYMERSRVEGDESKGGWEPILWVDDLVAYRRERKPSAPPPTAATNRGPCAVCGGDVIHSCPWYTPGGHYPLHEACNRLLEAASSKPAAPSCICGNGFNPECEAHHLNIQSPDFEKLYNELLYAVARKFPGESRHATALRYIREAEARGSGTAASSSAPPTPPQFSAIVCEVVPDCTSHLSCGNCLAVVGLTPDGRHRLAGFFGTQAGAEAAAKEYRGSGVCRCPFDAPMLHGNPLGWAVATTKEG